MKNVNSPFFGGFVVITSDVLLDKRLNYFEKIVFGEMYAMYNVGDLNEEAKLKIDEKYNEPVAKVNRAMNKLKKLSYVFE